MVCNRLIVYTFLEEPVYNLITNSELKDLYDIIFNKIHNHIECDEVPTNDLDLLELMFSIILKIFHFNEKDIRYVMKLMVEETQNYNVEQIYKNAEQIFEIAQSYMKYGILTFDQSDYNNVYKIHIY
jgi:hypothetical protein